MITIQKMKKNEVPTLYEMALSAFQPDYEQYGFYPPLINQVKKKFLPPLMFGKTIYKDETIIGAVFILVIGKKGEIGAIFLDPCYQHQNIGHEVMTLIEKIYPKVKSWKLETPSENTHLHQFYESLGYVKTKEFKDKKSNLNGDIYEKRID